jgi:DNA-binding CsgD family transcriptional regulator
MAGPAPGPRARTASELKAEIELERKGVPFIVYRDGEGKQQLFVLGGEEERLWLGRRPASDLRLGWDPEVSGLHAQLERGGQEWTLVDDGLSRNGSYVNGVRVRGRRRLRDGDLLRLGKTVMTYRAPGEGGLDTTLGSADVLTTAALSETQRQVLIALCRPFKDSAAFATPASNQQIADELFLSVETVKKHLHVLFEKFGVEHLPQNRKRLALVERALQSGLLSEHEL